MPFRLSIDLTDNTDFSFTTSGSDEEAVANLSMLLLRWRSEPRGTYTVVHNGGVRSVSYGDITGVTIKAVQ